MRFRALPELSALYWPGIYGAISLPLSRVIAGFDETYIFRHCTCLLKLRTSNVTVWQYWDWGSHENSLPGCIFWVINTGAVESGSPIFKSGVNQEVKEREREREECTAGMYCCPLRFPSSFSSHFPCSKIISNALFCIFHIKWLIENICFYEVWHN